MRIRTGSQGSDVEMSEHKAVSSHRHMMRYIPISDKIMDVSVSRIVAMKSMISALNPSMRKQYANWIGLSGSL